MHAKISLLVLVFALVMLPLSLQAQPSSPGFDFHKPPVPMNSSPAAMTTAGPELSAHPVIEASEPASPELIIDPHLIPDPNETSPQILERYGRVQRLIAQGAMRRARQVLEKAVTDFPESRHLRSLYADMLWHLSRGGADRALLERSAQEAVRAMEIGLGFGVVDYGLTDRLAQTLSRAGDAETFELLFAEAMARDEGPVVRRHYALGLSRMGSARAEEAFKAALELETEGDTHADYGEWLLDQGRHLDALSMLPKTPQIHYLYFLRGVALERANSLEEAKSAYASFRDFSASFPAPARFRIPGSSVQRDSGIHFDDESADLRTRGNGIVNVTAPITVDDALKGLSYLIWGEARGENPGGMIAAGWLVRARALRGTVGNPSCPAVSNSATALPDKYRSVICQSGQFVGACSYWCSSTTTTSCSSTAATNSAAYDVYYGTKPDPVSGHCPSGVTVAGDSCAGTQQCRGNTITYRLASPLFNLGKLDSESCATHFCAPNNFGKVCGNLGGRDNCFYGNTSCSGPGRQPMQFGTLSGTGANTVTPAFQVTTSGLISGHLEGTESQDFDLYLQSGSSSSGPWTDIPGAASTLYSSVEEVNYTGGAGWYRWRAYSYSGSGSFSICYRKPA